MNCQCQSNQLLKLTLNCQPHPHLPTPTPTPSNTPTQILTQIQQNFSQILQKQLQLLHQRKQQEISNLQQTVSKLKTEILRLENRNRLDRENQGRLKEEVRRLGERVREVQGEIGVERGKRRDLERERERERVEIGRVGDEERKVKEPVKKEIQHIQNPEILELKDKLVKLNAQKLTLQQTNTNLQDLLTKTTTHYQTLTQTLTQTLQSNLSQLQSDLDTKSTQLSLLQLQLTQLQQKNTLLSQPPKYNPNPIILHKVATLPTPQVRTVYVDRPIQRVEVVEVEKLVTRFVEPKRAVVNRVIECGGRELRRDQEGEEEWEREKQRERERMEQMHEEYTGVINSYKGQQQKLLKAIENRDSQYRLLTKKLDLIQKITSKPSTKHNHQQTIDIKVWKHGQRTQSEASQKQKPPQKKPAIKQPPTRTQQKTRKK